MRPRIGSGAGCRQLRSTASRRRGSRHRRSAIRPGANVVDQGFHLGVEALLLLTQKQCPPAQLAQRGQRGEADNVIVAAPRFQRRTRSNQGDWGQVLESCPDFVGCGEAQVAHLVQDRDPLSRRRPASDSDHPDCLDLPGTRLGHAGRCPRQCGSGSGDRVDGVGLAGPMSGLSVRSVDLDDSNAFASQVSGDAGAVGAGPFDADQVDVTECGEPRNQFGGSRQWWCRTFRLRGLLRSGRRQQQRGSRGGCQCRP